MRLLTVLAFMLFAPVAALAEMRLVMVEQAGCAYCAAWDEAIGPIYPKTSEGAAAPLLKVDMHDLPADITFARPPLFTPTFVLMQDGVEIGRIEGYPGEDFFWGLLNQMIETAQPSEMVQG